jgi:hypothetical protein
MRYLQSIIAFVLFLSYLSLNGLGQHQQPSPPPEDPVYSMKEVDRQAVITNRKKLDPQSLGVPSDCPSGAEVMVKAVLRKSGAVTDIKVIKHAGCSLDDKAAKIMSYTTFTPALKNGAPVSQSIVILFWFRKY